MANPLRLYTESEYMEIVNYIIEKQEYDRLRSDSFWKEMESAGVCKAKNRSWSSMKETFRKRIYQRLVRRQIKISPQELIAINKAYEQREKTGTSRKMSRATNKKKVPVVSAEKLKEFLQSDDDEDNIR